MGKNAPLLLLTRPQAQSERFLSQLNSAAWSVISPILDIKATGKQIDPRSFSAIILTSANGLIGVDADLADMPCFAVGDTTAEEARLRGLSVISAGGTADDLVKLICAHDPQGPLLFLRGEHSRGDVATRLAEAGIDVQETVTYRQIEHPLSTEAKAALEQAQNVVIPVFSPRSARLLSQALAKLPMNAQLTMIAMSDAVAEAWGSRSKAEVLVVDEPTAQAMAEAVRAALKSTS